MARATRRGRSFLSRGFGVIDEEAALGLCHSAMTYSSHSSHPHAVTWHRGVTVAMSVMTVTASERVGG
jgi:hypothetical protein